jgi:DNA primase
MNKTNLFNYIKERASIFQVVSEHVTLKKAGQYWKGTCPFHDEKTASFTCSPERGIFYCFGCHEGGDVIAFIGKIENCPPLEAAKFLADRYNIELPQEVLSAVPSEQTVDDKKRYFELCKAVAQWTHTELEKHASITSYLNKRGFTQDSIDNFKIGYFPGGVRSIKALVKELNNKNFLLKELLDFHIVAENKGTLYSPYEQRLIFPIQDNLGRFCGFGGRIIKSTDQRPKYYNSRENHFFQKGSLLFGLDRAKKEIQKKEYVFLTEGYTDCIAMAQYGYTNAVATLGTSCTVDHLKLLSYHAQKVYLVYDSDAAGQKAMLRLAELCWQVNLDLLVLSLPDGQDPDSFLKSGGNFETLVEHAQDIFTFFLENCGKEFSQQSLQQKLAVMRKYLAIIKNLDDPLKQDILLQKAATVFQIPFASLKEELKRSKGSFSNSANPAPPQKDDLKLISDKISPFEKSFFCAILDNHQLLNNKEVTRVINYIPEALQKIIEKLKLSHTAKETYRFIHFFETLDYHEKQLVNQMLLSQDQKEQAEDFEHLILILEKKYWKTIVTDTKVKISQAQQENDATEINTIVNSFLKLKKKLLRKGLI